MKTETKNELLKDKIYDRVKHRQPATDEIITRVQFADALERKDREIAALKEEVITLKHELYTVKSRNKKLCNILGQGESKLKDSYFLTTRHYCLFCRKTAGHRPSLSVHSDQFRAYCIQVPVI